MEKWFLEVEGLGFHREVHVRNTPARKPHSGPHGMDATKNQLFSGLFNSTV
jgi:hypothetical protein